MSTQTYHKTSTNIKSLIEASITFLENKEFDNALYCLDKIKKNYIFNDINYYYSITFLYYGNFKLNSRNYKRAIELYLKANQYSKNVEYNFQNEILINLASCYQYLKDFENAKNIYEKLLNNKNKPEISEGLLLYAKISSGDWTNMDQLLVKIKRKLEMGISSVTPFTSILTTDNPKLQYLAAKNFSTKFLNKKLFPNVNLAKDKNKKIKIAYLSSDFYNHATAHLISKMFELQNNNKFDYHAFSYGENYHHPITNRIKASFKKFISINDKTDAEVHELLIRHKIDILVDLKGHTKNNRLGVLSKRPCPIQVSFLGFPGTLGTNFIDYLIMDKYVINEVNRKFFSEKIIYLPNCYQCNEIRAIKKVNKKDFNLPENKIILCSLNNSQKYNFSTLNAWKTILKNNPDTILWLLDDGKKVNEKILAYFKNDNIKADRILFAKKVDTLTHISRMSLADIFLDSFPCNAHTTASDALQANLPIVTISGKSMSSRVAGSLLNTLGLNELICSNFYQYVDKVNYLIKNKKKLKKLKIEIKEKKSLYLFNSKLFVTNIEKAYEKIWHHHLNGNKIADIFI